MQQIEALKLNLRQRPCMARQVGTILALVHFLKGNKIVFITSKERQKIPISTFNPVH